VEDLGLPLEPRAEVVPLVEFVEITESVE